MFKIAIGLFGLLATVSAFASTELPSELTSALPSEMRPGSGYTLVDRQNLARLEAERTAAQGAVDAARTTARGAPIETSEMTTARRNIADARARLAAFEQRRLEQEQIVQRRGSSSDEGRTARREMARILGEMTTLEERLAGHERALQAASDAAATAAQTAQGTLTTRLSEYATASSTANQARDRAGREDRALRDVLTAMENSLNRGQILMRMQDLQRQFGHIDRDLMGIKTRIISTLHGTALDYFIQDRVARGMAGALSTAVVCQKLRSCSTTTESQIEDSFLRDVRQAVDRANTGRPRSTGRQAN